MTLPVSAVEHQQAQKRLTAQAIARGRAIWRRLDGDFDTAWQVLGPALFMVVAGAQYAAAVESAGYMSAVVQDLDLGGTPEGRLDPRSLAGETSQGLPLENLLYSPIIATRTALGQGSGMAQAKAVGQQVLDGIIQGQVADATRDAESVEIAVRPWVTGYVRMLRLPSCKRCVVLAGRFYLWDAGFDRHPGCDCLHAPANADIADRMTIDPRAAVESGQVTGLSQDDTRAIVQARADPNQVINASRGMETAQVYGRRLKVTTAGTTSRGIAGKRLGDLAKERGSRYRRSAVPRLRPESIFKVAENRQQAIEMLHRFGYIV